jgi:hypothetical protein
MAKLPQKADVDDDLAEADIVLPQRSVPELMAELERSKQDELERLAEKLESDPIGDLLGDLPTLIQGLDLIRDRIPPWLYSRVRDALVEQVKQKSKSLSKQQRRWRTARLLLELGRMGWTGKEDGAFKIASEIHKRLNDAVEPGTMKKAYIAIEGQLPSEERRPRTHRPKF